MELEVSVADVRISGNKSLYPGVAAEYSCTADKAGSLVWSLQYEDGEDAPYTVVKDDHDATEDTSTISLKAADNHEAIKITCTSGGVHNTMLVNIQSK